MTTDRTWPLASEPLPPELAGLYPNWEGGMATHALEALVAGAERAQLLTDMPRPLSYMDVDAASEIWESLGQEYVFLANRDSQMIAGIGQEMATGGYTLKAAGGGKQFGVISLGRVMEEHLGRAASLMMQPFIQQELNREKLNQDVDRMLASVDRNSFYAKLYSEVPLAITTGEVSSVEDVMKAFDFPPSMDTTEIARVREVIIGMFSIISRSPEALQDIAAYGLEGFEYDFFPELVAPAKVPLPSPVSLHRLSVDEIVKYLATPKTPEGTMTESEWHDLLKSEGYSQEDIDGLQHLKDESADMVASWSDRRETIEEIRNSVSKLPDYKVTDFLKDLLLYPTLAFMEPLHAYFEWVSMPIAGQLYRHIAPGLDAEYRRLRREYGPWEAASRAWQEWDYNWFVKYMVMEGIVDPLTYVGFGIAGKIGVKIGVTGIGRSATKFPRVAKPFMLAGAAEGAMMGVFELPFDAFKAVWRRMPKTLLQKATSVASTDTKIVKKYYEHSSRLAGGSRVIHSVQPNVMRDATELAIDYAFAHPFGYKAPALAGKAFLKHAPVDDVLAKSWATDLGSKLKPEQFTRQTIANVDETFEHFFWGLITEDEAAARLLQILHVPGAATRAEVGVTMTAAKRMLTARKATIKSIAVSHLSIESTAYQAMKSFTKRSFRIEETALRSAAYRSRSEVGALSALLVGVDARLSALWRNTIDKRIVRPFAEAYLTFGMYGPMNVVEDYLRCALGGVKPGRMKIKELEETFSGLLYDPELLRPGFSEMLGPLQRASTDASHNNWLLGGIFLGNRRGNWVYRKFVLEPGGIGAEVRRNFISGRYFQELKEIAGDRLARLYRATGKTNLTDMPGVTHAHAKIIENKAKRLIQTGDSNSIRRLHQELTEHHFKMAELDDMLNFYPEIANEIRADIYAARRAGQLNSNDSILAYFKGPETGLEARSREMFLHSPELAAMQTKALEDLLMEFSIHNPQDLAQALQTLYHMQAYYGAMPKQVIAQATIHTRGLPIVKRHDAINSYLDELTRYIDNAGASIDNVTEKLRRVAHEPQMAGVIDWTKVKISRNVPRVQRVNIQKWCDNLPINLKYTIKEIKFDPRRCTELKANAYWNAKTGTLAYKDTNTVIERTTYHELGHSTMSNLLDENDVEVIAMFADAMGQTELAAGIRRSGAAPYRGSKELKNIHEEFAGAFAYWCGMRDMESFVPRYIKFLPDAEAAGKAAPKKLQAFFDEHFPLTQRPLDLPADYLTGSQRLIDRMTAARMLGEEFALENVAYRKTYFAEATREMQKDPKFWDTFYHGIGDLTNKFNKEMAGIHGDMSEIIGGLNRAMGGGYERAAIIVEGRALAPDDIGRLLEVRSEDITSNLLSSMIVQNDRDYFVEYVFRMADQSKDVGFTREAIGNCYDQIMHSLGHKPDTVNWLSGRMQQLDGLRQDLHRLHNSHVMPPKERDIYGKWLDGVADGMDKEMYTKVPGKGEAPPTMALKKEWADWDAVRQSAYDRAQKWYYKEYPDYTNANFVDAIMKTIYPYWTYESVDESSQMLTRRGWKYWHQLSVGEEVLSLNPETMCSEWVPLEHINVYDFDGEVFHMRDKEADFIFTKDHNWLVVDMVHRTGYFDDVVKFAKSSDLRHRYRVPRGVGHKATDSILTPLEAAVLGWVVTDGQREKQQFTITQVKPERVAALFDLLSFYGEVKYRFYPPDYYRFIVPKECQAKIDAVYSGLHDLMSVVTHLDQESAGEMLGTMMLGDGDDYGKFWQNAGLVMEAFQALCIIAGKTANVNSRVHNGFPSQYTTVSSVKYRHMANIYPVDYEGKMWCPTVKYGTFLMRRNGKVIWTGNSQRWFWLPRAFLRHPGLATEGGRWLDNTDRGYIHIPHTSIDVNPFRGTVFGVLTTRLMRRDYPEYYDQLPHLGNFVEFNDYLSRWGFYPGVHISFPLAFMGGVEAQLGETLPAMGKTPFNALIAMFPDKSSGVGALVNSLSEKLFNDRFRDYATILEVNKIGYNGSHIWSKMQEGKELTIEEENAWNSARRTAALYGMGFEQFGLFRLRSDEQYAVYEESSAIVEEMTGFTPDQQQWLREHGQSVWDMVGGMSPTEQAILQELEYYRWVGSTTPLLPSEQQQELTALDVAWSEVDDYVVEQRAVKEQLELEFLSGVIGPDAYNGALADSYDDQRAFIDNKMEEYPLMRLENRAEYYEKYGIVQPVMHPMKELLNLYFDVELKDTYDPATGEKMRDWDSFWAERRVIEMAIPKHLRSEWEMYLSRHSTPMEMLRRQSWNEYFRTYYAVWDAVLDTYSEQEQTLLTEFFYLERTGQELDRQAYIKGLTSDKTGNLLISSFRTDISDNREALRAANPMLDAWLYYWGRSTSFKTSQARISYERLLLSTGRAGSSVT